VTTEGSATRQGFVFAKTSHVSKTSVRLGEPAVANQKVITDFEFDVRFQDAQFDLSDERYDELSSIIVPLGVDVVKSKTGGKLESKLEFAPVRKVSRE
jgi:hypothetical protein